MKQLNKYLMLFLVIIVFCSYKTMAQDAKPSLIIDLAYNQQNNRIPFVSVYTKAKIEKKFTAIPNIVVSVFLDEASHSHLIGTVKTNAEGKGRLGFPINLKNTWDSLQSFMLIATSPATPQFDSTGTESSITKAKIFIHSSIKDSIKTIEVMVKEKKGQDWIPVPGVETKVTIKRSVGELTVGDDETYTTDSTGVAIAEFKKTGIPGDKHGNIVIVAKTEDNDQFGNISIEQNLKWGVPLVIQNNFNQRTLFATRGKAPVWLMLVASSVFVIVWSVIFYLVWQLLQIRKAGIAKNETVI